MRPEPEIDPTEHGVVEAGPDAPCLIIQPDPDSRIDLGRPLLGRTTAERLTTTALESGFAAAYLAPGTKTTPEGAQELAAGDPVRGPALVVFEGSYVHPELLTLMVRHPLEPDERFTLYDEVGRPTAWFTGYLDDVPSMMPISEELDWPEELGPVDIARVVDLEDRERMEQLVARAERLFDVGKSRWRRHVSMPTLRWLANSRWPLGQVELFALATALVAGPLALLGSHVGFILAGVLLLAGSHVNALLGIVRMLRHRDVGGRGRHVPGESVSRATRPLAHAAMTAALTYVLVAETDRSTVAALVLLAAGGAATLFALGHARKLLHERPAETFALPDAGALADRLGVRIPELLAGAPALELAVLLAVLPGHAELPWLVLAGAGLARLWRWFAGPGALS